MGKGSRQRPSDKKKFNEGWDRIFNKKGANELSSTAPKRDRTDTPLSKRV